MSDLRTRLIDVLKAAIADLASGYCSVQPDNLMSIDGGIYVDELADAVIAELSLTMDYSGDGPHHDSTRYVTEWFRRDTPTR